MQVTAFSTPERPDWRWRIVNYAGEVLEESHTAFRTIPAAIAEGTKRMAEMNITDRSVPLARTRGSTFHRRSR
jgi:hypothetical protein